ncbi:MAG: GGDEF domain-containing protein [Pseudomonadota bacterium]
MTDNAPKESRYAHQLRRRFPTLRFASELECEYRSEHLATIRNRVIASLLVALTFVLWHVFVTRTGSFGDTVPPLADDLRAWVMRPVAVVLLVSALLRNFYARHWLTVAPVLLAILGSVGAFNVAMLVANGNVHAFISMLTGFFGVYMLMGLLFWQLVAVGSVLTLVFIANLVYAGAPIDVIQVEAPIMFTATALACVFIYSLEHSQRTAFLQRKVLEEIGNHDALTQLKNRRAFDEALTMLWQQGIREGKPVGLLLLDVDHFKPYNDHYGHQAGDRCLAAIGTVLRCVTTRPFDIAARIGGEEFAVLFYNCTHEHLVATGERLVLGVQGLGIEHERSPVAGELTASVGGVLVQPQTERSSRSLLQFADEALYTAKNRGRNRVVIERDGYENIVTGAFRGTQIQKRIVG